MPFQLQVLELDGDRVRHVSAFFDTSLFAAFGLPASLPAETEHAAAECAASTREPDPR